MTATDQTSEAIVDDEAKSQVDESERKEDRHRKRFFWGSVLTLVTLLPWAVTFAYVTLSIMLHRPNPGSFLSDPHLLMIYMKFRIAVSSAAALAAIAFLVCSFRLGHPIRAVASVFQIVWNIWVVLLSVFLMRMLYVRW